MQKAADAERFTRRAGGLPVLEAWFTSLQGNYDTVAGVLFWLLLHPNQDHEGQRKQKGHSSSGTHDIRSRIPSDEM